MYLATYTLLARSRFMENNTIILFWVGVKAGAAHGNHITPLGKVNI